MSNKPTYSCWGSTPITKRIIDALDALAGRGDTTDRPAGLRIELDEDDQAEDVRTIRRFPVYIRCLLARQITVGQHHDPPLSIADLDRWTDGELADFAELYAPSTANTDRHRSYLRILAVALRHFSGDPAKIRAAVVVVVMVAQRGTAWRNG